MTYDNNSRRNNYGRKNSDLTEWFCLYQKPSKKGVEYLSGKLDGQQILGFQGKKPASNGAIVWQIYRVNEQDAGAADREEQKREKNDDSPFFNDEIPF